MLLPDNRYREILHDYEIRHRSAQMDAMKRRHEVEAAFPEFRALSEEISRLALASAKEYIQGNDRALDGIREKIAGLSTSREKLLRAHGYPVNYLKPFYRCSDCEDTGFIGKKRCHCLEQRLSDILYDQSNIRPVLEKENFSSFRLDIYSPEVRSEMKTVYEAAKDFVARFGKTGSGNLLFLGRVGSGKTFMTNCIAGALIDRGFSCLYFTSVAFFNLLSDAAFGNSSENSDRERCRDIFDCDLLVLDDLGTENPNSFVRSRLFMTLSERARLQKSIIISSNLTLGEIQSNYNERNLSRILSNYDIYNFNSDDLRLRK
ncbi:MAG: ATP-binding protein [Lachnospiraceae bacterium]|nr:ATP-binding protein [Lachnospiraceae bacterium]